VATASEKTKITFLRRTRTQGRGSGATGSLVERCRETFLNSFRADRPKWMILFFLSLITSFFLFPGILLKPVNYTIGDVAVRDIKASRDFLVENKELTEKDMEKAAREVLSVYDFDPSIASITKVINEAFVLGREYVAKTLEKEQSPVAVPEIGRASCRERV